VHVAGGKYAADRLTGAPEGRFINAGLSIALSGGDRTLPKPAGAPRLAAGMTRLSITARDARQVELAGDFTRWEMKPAQRAANGVWYVDVAVAPGRYRYAFRIDGKEWRTPEGAVTADGTTDIAGHNLNDRFRNRRCESADQREYHVVGCGPS
jgi:hypothetical protein